MSRLPNPVRWRDLSGGVVQKVAPGITLENSTPFSINLLYEENLGEAKSRLGTDIVGSQLEAGQTCMGLYQHLDNTAANDKLFAAFNGTIYDVLAGSSSVTGLTAGNKARFTTFINSTLMLNGAEARSYTAAGGWVSSGGAFGLGGQPANAKYPIEFKDRVYAAVDDRLYYTSTPSSNTVSWTASGSGSLYVEREDGGGTIQGVSKVPGYLLIYKQRSLKRWNTESTFPDDLVKVGTQSSESIVTAAGRNFFFYGPNGFYQTEGSYPQLISRPMQRFIDAIPASKYASIYGWSNDEHIWWAVGDLTVNFDRGYTESYSNVVLRYTIRSQQWAPLSYGHSFDFMHQYLIRTGSDNSAYVVLGTDDGQVLQLDTGNTDYSGQAIKYILQSPEIDYGDRGKLKTVSDKIIVHSDGTKGAELQARMNYGDWSSVGTVDDIVSEVQLKQALSGNVFEFRIVDSITGDQIKLSGLDWPNVFIHDSRT